MIDSLTIIRYNDVIKQIEELQKEIEKIGNNKEALKGFTYLNDTSYFLSRASGAFQVFIQEVRNK